MADLLIRLGLDVNARNIYGETPLHLAVQFNNGMIADRLLFEGADANARNKRKESPLHLAVSRGTEDIVTMLLNNNAKINITDENGAKPIHYAVKSGKAFIIRNLLNNGSSLMEFDNRHNTVLHYACEKGDSELVSFILRYMTVNNIRNIYGDTPLHLAAGNCQVDSVRMLVNNGYEISAQNLSHQTPTDIALQKKNMQTYDFLSNYPNSTEYRERFLKYPLHRAASSGNYELLGQLIGGHQVNELDYFGKTPLYYAVMIGSLRCTQFLYQHGADIRTVDSYKQTALLIAIYNENLRIIEFLLQQKADPNEVFYNRSYLYRAILRNNYEMAKVLIDYGADVNYIDSRYRTIYSYAIEYADDDIVGLLSDKNASML
jgi:ankyrin repeat protein